MYAGPYADPGLGRGEKIFENFLGAYGRKNEGGGRDPILRGGETPKNGEKVPFFGKIFELGGGGRAAPFAPSLRTGLMYVFLEDESNVVSFYWKVILLYYPVYTD